MTHYNFKRIGFDSFDIEISSIARFSFGSLRAFSYFCFLKPIQY